MKKLFLTCISLVILISCSQDFSETEVKSKILKSKNTPINDNYELKKKFALALHKAMVDNVEVRDFIKIEALKQFNNDYDVLYNFVKDGKAGKNSFRGIIASYFSDPDELLEIENILPTLTIYIPTLPENSFSAENWNTSNDVPLVAIRLLDSDKTPIISSNSDSFLFDHDVIPGFPVIVIKENERVVVPTYPFYSKNKAKEYISEGGFKFKFSHEYYDFIKPKGPLPTPIDDDVNRVVSAWNQNKDLPIYEQGWDRDYVYYNIYKDHPDGLFASTYSEFFTNFRIDGADGWNALNNISDSSEVNNPFNDPSLRNSFYGTNSISQGSFWTDGKFDFNLYVDYKRGEDANVFPFDARPEDLFDIIYQVDWAISNVKRYKIIGIVQKTFAVNQEIFTWDLYSYDNEWNFKIEEVDLSVEISKKSQSQSKKNGNITIEPTFGATKKWGPKLGASLENLTVLEKNVKYTEQSELLGETKVGFKDKVIINEHFGNLPYVDPKYSYRVYDVGKATFSLIPKRVQ